VDSQPAEDFAERVPADRGPRAGAFDVFLGFVPFMGNEGLA
jgi:hypothetical protein